MLVILQQQPQNTGRKSNTNISLKKAQFLFCSSVNYFLKPSTAVTHELALCWATACVLQLIRLHYFLKNQLPFVKAEQPAQKHIFNTAQ